MKKFNAKNERIKRAYLEWRGESHGSAPSTMDNIRKALDRWEEFTQYQDFSKFNKTTAVPFKKHLTETTAVLSGEILSKSHISSTLYILREFFTWLSNEPGYRCIDPRDIAYLNLSAKDLRIARTKNRERIPTIAEIRTIIKAMPTETETNMRDQAVVAGIFVTGMRDDAAASLPLKYALLPEELVEQRGKSMRTKASKTIYTYFYPVGSDIEEIFTNWVRYLRGKRHFTGDDPVFPQTNIIPGPNTEFISTGVKPLFWANANPIRKIFKTACERVGLPYFNPHSFRNALALLGLKVCKTPEEFKAWSQNMGHDMVMTTFKNYGEIPEYRQGEIMKEIKQRLMNNKGPVQD